MPEVNEESNRGGWLHAGDRGYLDEDGYLFVAGREKGAIRRTLDPVELARFGESNMSYFMVLRLTEFPSCRRR